MNLPQPKKYRNLDEWKDCFDDSPAEVQMGLINALSPHNFEYEFDLTNSAFVAEVIEALYSKVMNVFIPQEIQAQAGWKATYLVSHVKDQWNTMRQTIHETLNMVSKLNWRFDPYAQQFLIDFITFVDPSDSHHAIGAFVNKLYGEDMLHIMRRDKKWAGNPLVIEWIIRSLTLSGPVKRDIDWNLKELVDCDESGEENVQAVEALFFHLASAGELDEAFKEAVVKYLPLGPAKDGEWPEEISDNTE